jgi:hypothetical protein
MSLRSRVKKLERDAYPRLVAKMFAGGRTMSDLSDAELDELIGNAPGLRAMSDAELAEIAMTDEEHARYVAWCIRRVRG